MDFSKYLTHDERLTLEATCVRNMLTDRRNAVMLLTALKCGLRAQELLNLKHSDLDFNNQTVRVRTLKCGATRSMPAPRCLFDFASASPRDSVIFGIGYQRLIQVWHIYRPVRKKFHALRHAFALEAFHKRKDIKLVQFLLGHKSLSSTGIYLDTPYSVNDLKKAMGVK